MNERNKKHTEKKDNEHIEKRWRTLLYIIILVLSSCESPIDITDDIVPEIVEVPAEEQPVDDSHELTVIDEDQVIDDVLEPAEVVERPVIELPSIVEPVVVEPIELPVIDPVEPKIIPVPIVEPVVIIEKVVEPDIIELPVEPEIFEEEIVIMIEPIKIYDNYISSNGKVFGIIGSQRDEVFLTDGEVSYPFKSFFGIAGDKYFSTSYMEQGDAIPETDPVQYEAVEVVKYFKQIGSDLLEITEVDFPEVPAMERITFVSSPFKIEDFDYKGDILSKIFKGPLERNMLGVESACANESGLWFSCDTGIPGTAAAAGLYFWDSGNNGVVIRKGDPVRIW